MAHARRGFDEALSNDAVRAKYVLEQMQKLYAIERRAKEENMHPAQRYELRQAESVALLQGLHQ